MRRIRKAKVEFLSLCKRGANGMRTLLKGDGAFELDSFLRESPSFDESGELYFVGYIPEHRDSEGDIADAALVKEMAYDWMRNGGKLDMRHDGKALDRDAAYPVESFIIQKGDPRFADWKDYEGKPIDVTNGWGGVLKIEDAALRKKYRSKEWDGVSVGGTALFELNKEQDSSAIERVLASLAKKLGLQDAIDMDAKELTKLVTDTVAAALEPLKKDLEALKPPTPVVPVTPKAAEPVAFKGDPNDAAAVKAHLAKIKLAKIDWNDAAAVEAHMASLTKEEAPQSPEMKAALQEQARLEKRISKLQKASTQDTKGPGDDEDEDDEHGELTKEQRDRLSLGTKMADRINKNRGYEAQKAS